MTFTATAWRALAVASSTLERVVWILFTAVVALVLREFWQAYVSWRDRRRRDRNRLSAAFREVNSTLGLAASIRAALEREVQPLESSRDWSIKPLVRLPEGVYEILRDDVPSSLLNRPNATIDLVRLQHQSSWTNYLADTQMTWKGPLGVGHPNRAEMIENYGIMLQESIATVIERGERLAAAIREAGEDLGGLDMQDG